MGNAYISLVLRGWEMGMEKCFSGPCICWIRSLWLQCDVLWSWQGLRLWVVQNGLVQAVGRCAWYLSEHASIHLLTCELHSNLRQSKGGRQHALSLQC